MDGRLIAIGDIHGCLAALNAILQAIAPQPTDTIVALGDYVDRGPDSKGVIDRLIELGQQCKLVSLQGNHEEMMLDVVKGGQPPYRWLQYGGVDTLDSYRFSGDMSVIPAEHHAFFASMLDYFETDEHIFVHANYEHDKPLSAQGKQVLRWLKLTDVTPPPHVSGKKAILGHTHDRAGELFDLGHMLCIDTYCYGGGWLTAIEVRTGQLWQADIDGNLRHA
ncbi:MAG: metallophosphoesterase family protein [Pirellulaceae bacterium]